MEPIVPQYVTRAKQAALDVDCIETVEEFRLYYKALYRAMIWGNDKLSKEKKNTTSKWYINDVNT